MTPAALYMMKGSIMFDFLPKDRIWTIERDARKYAGPYPVIAAPPCAQFSRLRHFARDDAEARSCAPRAVEQVREFGGVLEHPAQSLLWKEFNLPAPGGIDTDEFGGWTLECHQFDFGHVALKKTWLYIVGVSHEEVMRLFPCKKNQERPFRLWTPRVSKNGKTKYETIADQRKRLFGQRTNTPQKVFTGSGQKSIPGSRWYLRIAYPPDFAAFLISVASLARPVK